MLFVGIVGDGKSQTAGCAVIAVHGMQDFHRLAQTEAAAPPELRGLLEVLIGAEAQRADLLARANRQAGEWLGALARDALASAGYPPQAVELAGCAGLRMDSGLALGDLAAASHASGLLITALPTPAGAGSPGEQALDCARAAWRLWLDVRQPAPAATGSSGAPGNSGANPLTEERNPATTEIDHLPSLEMVRLINIEDSRVARAVGSQLPAIAEAVDLVAERMRRGGRLIYAGAGTSGRIGVLDASEIPPTYGTPPELVAAAIAGGEVAVRSSLEGVEDDTRAGAAAMQELSLGADDSLVGIAASGRTPYVLAAMQEARRRGALVISLACNSPSPMEALADVVIAPLVGPEVITGSTRMKAGTAQKLVLNMLSTCVMVRLGKTYSNLMVDMQASNTKLRGRARRMVTVLAGVGEAQAAQILDAAGGELKTAIVMARTGLDAQAARERLHRRNGVVRAAVEAGEEKP